MSDLDEFLGDFRTESNEALDQVENQLLAMESGDKEAVNSVFRAFHSIKGGAAFLDLKQIRSLTH
jgi:two-component system chemotaxis sensor kinase CheA